MQPHPLLVTLVTFELVCQFKSSLQEVKREVPAHFMKVGGLLTDGCTNSICPTPVSSCMACAAPATRNGCCARSWVPRWFRAGWNATAMATCFVLCCQLNSHHLPWAVATAGGEALGRRRGTFGEKMQNSTSWHCTRGRTTSLSAVSVPGFEPLTDVAELPLWSRVSCP